MIETTDTSMYQNNEIQDGQHEFEIISVRKKLGGAKKDKPFYIWTLRFGEDKEADQILMAGMMGDLLRVLDCNEVAPNKFEWDRDAQEGKRFIATVSHAPDKKDSTKIRQNMTGFKKLIKKEDDIPF